MSATSTRDCDCYVTENYFVDKVLNRRLRMHLYYDGTKDIVKEQLEQMYGLVDDKELSQEEYKCVFQMLNEERTRRMNLEVEHQNRKAAILERYNQRRANSDNENKASETIGEKSEPLLRLQVNLEETIERNNEDDGWLTQGCLAALRAAATTRTPPSKSEILTLSGGIELLPDRLYALPIFTPRACQLLDNQFKDYAETYHDIKGRPNTMNRFGVLLDEMPANNMSQDVSDVLVRDIIRPLAVCLLGNKNVEGDDDDMTQEEKQEREIIHDMCQTLDHHHVFTVDYRAQEGYDKDLSLHFDNAEVTMNILLTKPEEDFEGGELSFEGPSHVSPSSHHRHPAANKKAKKSVYYEHQLGWGILHMGCEMHRALPVDSGRRSNLIVWCRSGSHRLQHGCPMCGDTNRLKHDVLRQYLQQQQPGWLGVGWDVGGRVMNGLQKFIRIR